MHSVPCDASAVLADKGMKMLRTLGCSNLLVEGTVRVQIGRVRNLRMSSTEQVSSLVAMVEIKQAKYFGLQNDMTSYVLRL